MKQLNFNDVIENSSLSKLCLSIYLPYQTNEVNSQQRDSQLKSIKKQINSLLDNLSESEKSTVLKKLETDYYAISELQLKHGVAWFYSDLVYGYMPISLDNAPFVVAADSFHIKPLLRDRQISKPFFVLLVGSKSVRLFSNCSGFLKLIESNDPQITGPAISSMNLKKIVITSEKLITRHCSSTSDPLILAGPKILISTISEELSYPYKISPFITCRDDLITLEDLKEKSENVSKSYYKSLEDKIVSDFQYCQVSKDVILDIEKISAAAIAGQIENLIVAEDYNVWGVLNKVSGSVKIHKKQRNLTDDDLLDDISEVVHRFKGNVWVIPKEKLKGSPIYATLRW